MTPNGLRRSASVPPSNPFWSDRAQQEHVLQHLRPGDLDGRSTPVPQDDDLESPRPLQVEPSGVQGRESGEQLTQFETPAAGHPEKPQGAVATETESKEGGNEAALNPGRDDVAGRKFERAWKRRAHGGSNQNDVKRDGNEVSEIQNESLENELGVQVVQHLQNEASMLQSQNDILIKDIQQLSYER